MRFVIPQIIDFPLANTNVPVEEFWSDGATPLEEWTSKTYNTSDEVKVLADKKKYKFAGVDGTQSDVTPSQDSDNWTSAPLNPFAMINEKNSSVTKNQDSIEANFSATNIDAIHLFKIKASQVNIKIKHNTITTEDMAIGNGTATSFTHTSTVVPFKGFVEVWVNGVKEAEDVNGDGVLTNVVGNYALVTGAIDYTTKFLSVSFTTPPLASLVIEMRYNAELYSISQDMTYDDLDNFGDYLFSEQELRNALTARIPPATLDVVIASMSEAQIVTQFTANPPIYYDMQVYIDIQNQGSIAELGYIVVGRQRELGVSLYGGSIGLKNTSTRERDSWGNVVSIPGTIYDIMDIPVKVLDSQVDTIKQRLGSVANIPCVYIGDDTEDVFYNSMTIYGYYYDLETPITVNYSKYNLRVESIL